MPQTKSDRFNAAADGQMVNDVADYLEALELASRLQRIRQSSRRLRAPNAEEENKQENNVAAGDNSQETENLSQAEKEQKWAERMRGLSRLSQLSGTALRAAGYGQLGEALGDIGSITGAAGSGQGGGVGGLRKAGSNLAGSQTSKIAQKRGLSAGKSSAIGGAVAGALAGEGVKGIGQNALSWYVVNAMFVLLLDPTLILNLPALAYLNVHYVMSKRESKWFRPMFIWQKFTLLFVDIIFFFIILLVITVIYFVYYLYKNPTEALKLGIGL